MEKLQSNIVRSDLRPLKIALYSFGNHHTIDKYYQVMSLIDRMVNDSRFKPCILLDGNGSADKDLVKKYSGRIPVYATDYFRSHILGIDAVIVIDPYSIPKISYRDLREMGIKIIYKEYGAAGIEAGTGYLVNRSSYRYADLIVTENEFTKSDILKKYPDKKVVIGSPAFDYRFDEYEDDERFEKDKHHVLWTPHHSVMSKESFDLIEGGVYSTFVTYKDYLTGQFLEENPDSVLHIKFHPILGKRYNAYCKANGVNDTFSQFLKKIKDHPRIFIHDGEDYHHLFFHSDVILNDSVSFIQEWLPTDKPMLVLEDESKSKYSPYGEMLIDKCYYRVKSIEDLRDIFLVPRDDYKYGVRREFIDSLYIDPKKPNSESLLNVIYSLGKE